MMTDKELKLLIDLCRQIDKHGIDTFLSLIEKTRNTEVLSNLDKLSPIVKKRSISTKSRSKISSDKKITTLLDEFKNDQKEHAELLKIYAYLKKNSASQVIKRVKNFLNINNRASSGLNTKESAIEYIIREIIRNSTLREEAKHFFIDESDRSLSAWTETIMRNKLAHDDK